MTSLTHFRAFSIDSIAMSVVQSISQTPMVEILAGEGAKENDLEVDSGNGCDDVNGCQACHRNGGGASLSARTILLFLDKSGILD